jgi:uncharacterized protein DUF3631
VADERAHAKPGMPASLSDRQVDIWEPLLAIADPAGGDWPTRARTAAVELHGHDPTADPGIGALLLSHIREVFDAEPTDSSMDAMASDKLLRALTERYDGPWGDWWGGDVANRNVRGPAPANWPSCCAPTASNRTRCGPTMARRAGTAARGSPRHSSCISRFRPTQRR